VLSVNTKVHSEPKYFYHFFRLTKGQLWVMRFGPMDIDDRIADLLADKAPAKARDLALAWPETRNSSWADAHREAEARSASKGHLPQHRGQLRYHYGQAGLVEACRRAGLGSIPMRTNPPGGIFIVGRVGRFALVSMTIRHQFLMPRRSLTRTMLSQANETIDPQEHLFGAKATVTELAYFGCLIAIPNRHDPSTPAELALAVPNVGITEWISWIPLHRLHGLLQARVDSHAGETGGTELPDLVIPKFRVPKQRKDTGEDEPSN
jgi:hypothetical protein